MNCSLQKLSRWLGQFHALLSAATLAAVASAQVPTGQPPQGQPPQGQPPSSQGAPLQPMLLPQAVVLPRGTREISIDGSLIDWPQLPALRLDDRRQLSGTGNGAWRGPNDASALAFLMWDDEALYFACTARDEWHRALDANTLLLTEIPAADSIVLTFDPARNTRSSGADPGRREDREFWLADEDAREVVQWDRLRGTARVLDQPDARIVVLNSKEQGITTYEARIPWHEILPPGRRAKIGMCIDLQVIVNDFDESTDSMPQTRLGWTFGMGPIIDPGLLGSMMLVDDSAALQGVMPEFPPKPGIVEPAVEPADYWQDLTARLLKWAPAVYDGSITPAEVGGIERLQVLEQIDDHCQRFPRVDYLELCQRIHRRMNREVAGLMARGLPSWWHDQLQSLAKQAADPVPDGAARLFRLPMGGWLVRSKNKGFVIDPAGNDLAEQLWGATEFCLLTQPLDMVRRNDQLLVRMFVAEPTRPVFAHIVFHLPVITMDKMPLVELGQTYGEATGVQVSVLGKARDDGAVAYDCSYRIQMAGGPSILVASPSLRPEDVEDAWGIDVMIASPRNVAIVDVAAKVTPGVVLLDDAFLCQSHPKTRRVSLRDLHALQRSLLPARSILLAPGESWLVTAGKPK